MVFQSLSLYEASFHATESPTAIFHSLGRLSFNLSPVRRISPSSRCCEKKSTGIAFFRNLAESSSANRGVQKKARRVCRSSNSFVPIMQQRMPIRVPDRELKDRGQRGNPDHCTKPCYDRRIAAMPPVHRAISRSHPHRHRCRFSFHPHIQLNFPSAPRNRE